MTKINEIYKCSICGNLVEMLHPGVGTMICCGKEMDLMQEKTSDPEISAEKHVPVIEKIDQIIKVTVGAIPHPMEESHYIEFIEIITEDGKIGRKCLQPENQPSAEFHTKSAIKEIRCYCNLHGVWKNSL